MNYFKCICLFILALSTLNCKKDTHVGIAKYSYNLDELELANFDNEHLFVNYQTLTFYLDFESIKECNKYDLYITAGKDVIFKGKCFEIGVIDVPCYKVDNARNLTFRLIDNKRSKVYQWDKKESYLLCKKNEVKVKLYYENYDGGYAIKFDNQFFYR